MTSASASAASAPATPAAARTRTGGPDDRSGLAEHLAGWTLVVVIAMLVTRLGLI
ncbi:SCO1431 family membrane protein [Streptomyces sp. NPDC001985]|uniref:SCO1431 family membrane protein n=1 Tax=Streptomyces sp. NPDC001985 TaxID=3154406 RepID=UPI00332CC183